MGWPTIGWLSDLETMSRNDLYNHYRNYYVPNNATLVIVGDIEPKEALRSVQQYFGSIERGNSPPSVQTREPEQKGERRVSVERPGTTCYLDVAFHAPAVRDEDFVPLLVADAVLFWWQGNQPLGGWFRARRPHHLAPLSGFGRARVSRRSIERVAANGAALSVQHLCNSS